MTKPVGVLVDPGDGEHRLSIDDWNHESGSWMVADPDGFNRQDPQLYNRLFTEAEFKQGLSGSTLMPKRQKVNNGEAQN